MAEKWIFWWWFDIVGSALSLSSHFEAVLYKCLISYCIVVSFSRGANYLVQILLRPGASDLTGSFRYLLTFIYSSYNLGFKTIVFEDLILTKEGFWRYSNRDDELLPRALVWYLMCMNLDIYKAHFSLLIMRGIIFPVTFITNLLMQWQWLCIIKTVAVWSVFSFKFIISGQTFRRGNFYCLCFNE